MTSTKHPGGLITRVKNIIDPPFDPTLVDNTAKLLDVLNRTDKLQKLLRKTDERGFTLLHIAAEKNQPESLKCLLIKEADPNVRSSVGSNEVTPLHIAASCGHLACLQLLVQASGDIMAQDQRQLTPIDCANLNGQDFCLKYLSDVIAQRQAEEQGDLEEVLMEVERNLAVDNIQTLNYWSRLNELFPVTVTGGYDLLHELTQMESMMYRQCILINSHELVKVLSRIAKDVPISLHNASMLHAACRYKRVELVRLLTRKFPSIILSLTNEGYHALHIAVAHKQVDICHVLVQTQVELYQKRYLGSSRETPVVESGQELAGTLGKFGAATISGHSVLHFAVALNQTDILALLLRRQKELQINIEANVCGYTALHLAVYLNNCDAVAMLLKNGANPNTCIDPKHDTLNISHTPLAETTVHKNLKILMALLNSGAEDKNHDAINVCLRSLSHRDMVVPLLGSLIKCDDGVKGNKSSRKERHVQRIKTGVIDWTNLQLTSIEPSWIADSLSTCNFLRVQSIGGSKLFECITSVNLSNNRLVSLPVEVFNLPKMTVLNASGNRLEALPDFKQLSNSHDDSLQWPCTMLSKIILCRNSLTQVPDYLFQLPNLSNLDLSHNCITSLPLAVWSSPKLHQLNCSHNQLRTIPTNWPQVMDTCTVIDAPSPAPVQKSPHPKKRYSLPTGISHSYSTKDGPKYLQSLPTHSDLDALLCTEDRRHTLEVASVSRLQDRLNICNANLPIEWESVETKEEDLEGLTLVNLSNNQIKDIPDNLPCLCPKLVRLDLSHNEIAEISLPHSFPATIKHLNLSHNPLVEINSKTTVMKPLPCTNPQVLFDQGNEIHIDNVSFCPHRHHAHLMSLGVLELNNCQLTSVNFFHSSAVTDKNKGKKNDPLMQAVTSKKSPSSRSVDRLVCPLLTRLILSHNHLSEVPESVCEMVSLNSLDLSYNDIIELPAALGNLCNLWEFPLNGLKLISPPHNIIERGKTKDIIGFLWSLLQRARPYHRMKLMLVGRAARGKTTLLQRISERGQRGIQENWALSRMAIPDKQKCDLSTVGIVVSDWTYYKRVRESQTSLKSITFMTWDFGGQEEYYATHQCFLSRRSLYLAVWNVTHGMKGTQELKPWLLNIQARAPHSPVIIVGTHTDKINTRTQRAELHNCLQFINNVYGTAVSRKEGFPQIMRSVVVSCKTGRGINELRDIIFDVASQVRENTVAGRGVGCGRIPEYRLLMDQLVPASYLQLEDTVRNHALSMRGRGKPPVLRYMELREMVFSDPRTLISKNTADRELEQAVRFLHDNGTLLHYDDPLLSDFYFVDPQWLCDMLAHLVTVREINPLVKDGIMRTADFPLIFNDEEFPISWKSEYIRLLTTFEVGVELGEGELLIPSALPTEKPPMPCTVFPDILRKLPSLRHTYIVPFIPSGFWPRLMSRVLTDRTIEQLAREGCCISEEDAAQLSWVKWRQGLMLQYGNITLMLIEELKGGLFLQKDSDGIKILRDDKWELHRKDIKIFGIDVVVPDVYPILKYPEVVKAQRSHHRDHYDSINSSSGTSCELSYDSAGESHDSGRPRVKVTEGCANKVVGMDQIDTEFLKLTRKRARLLTHTPSCFYSKPRTLEAVEPGEGRGPSPLPHPVRTDSWERKIRANSLERPSPFPRGSSTDVRPKPKPKEQPVIDEEKNDIMRAGLLSKAVEHITLLVEEWFTGVRPRHLVVPCPHCSSSEGSDLELQRSFSNTPSLVPEAEREARGISVGSSPESDVPALKGSRTKPTVPSGSPEPTRRMAYTGSGVRTISSLLHRRGHSLQRASRPTPDSRNYCYAFRYDDCVVAARSKDSIDCPGHGTIPLQYLAPDTVFLTQGRNIVVGPHDFIREDSIGHGAFATVFRARVKLKGEDFCPAALKALTKEWKHADSAPPDGTEPATPTKDLSRHSILEGFSNLKKELSVLSPLRHINIVRLLGVTLRPLGLILELAPKSSLKALLQSYAEAQMKIQCNVAQAVVVQVAAAIKYLHSSSIIYRDLKSDNVLVWQFPEPQDPIPGGCPLGQESVFVKLSDYGISQFVATQGAKGLVGTPGFMAPEIIKYHGREAYTKQVDIFSFGMFIYEILTLHIPYETLTAQQANQANESGARPSLTKKDFPCPVLLRELMVWCWQQNFEKRPKAAQIIETAQTEQFLRLLDGIRVSNDGQVTATCVRQCTSSPGARFFPRQKLGRRNSPVMTYASQGSGGHSPLLSRKQSSADSPGEVSRSAQVTARNSGLQSVSEEGDEVFEGVSGGRLCPVPLDGQKPGFGDYVSQGTSTSSQQMGSDCDAERTREAEFEATATKVKPEPTSECSQEGVDPGDADASSDTYDLPVGVEMGRSASGEESTTKSASDESYQKLIEETQNSDPSRLPLTVGTPPSQVTRVSEKSSLSEGDALSTADSGFDSTLSLIQLRKSTDSADQTRLVSDSLDRDASGSLPAGNTTRTTVETGRIGVKPLIAPIGKPTTAGIIPLQSNCSTSVSHQRSLSVDSSVPASLKQRPRQNASQPTQARRSSLESKKRWSPRFSERSSFSPGFESLTPTLKGWEEEAIFEIWVTSSDAHHTMATVLEYNGKFTSVEEIEIGDSPVLCMCTVRDKIWMGFEIGYLVIYDANTKRPCAQAWVNEHTSIRSVIHLAALKRVYVALGNGSVLAYDDDISCVMTSVAPARVKLLPAREYHHPNQSSSCLLAVPKFTANEQAQLGFEIWVGQKEGMITVLDAENLEVVKFIRNDLDQSRTPNYVAYLTFAHLVCSMSPEQATNGSSNQPQGEVTVIGDMCDSHAPKACVSVYGALYHGQYVTRWNAGSKTAVESFNCKRHLGNKDFSISSLHYSNLQLYVGLSCGKVLMLDAITFDCLCQLSCHRDYIRSLVTIDLGQLQDSEFYSSYKRDSSGSVLSTTRSNSTPPVSHSSPSGSSPVHLSEGVHRSSSLSSMQSQTLTSGHQLLSFGTGFQSYVDGPESKQYLKSGFLLVWEAEQSKTNE